jgi:hypothetical protein
MTTQPGKSLRGVTDKHASSRPPGSRLSGCGDCAWDAADGGMWR